jgi:hypothetical protein
LYANNADGTPRGSNTASFLSVLAPGTHICSAVPGNPVDCNWTGTSMAAHQSPVHVPRSANSVRGRRSAPR